MLSVLGLLVALSVIALCANCLVGQGFSQYRAISRGTLSASELVREVYDTRLSSLQYRFSPHEAELAEVSANLEDILTHGELFAEVFADNEEAVATFNGVVEKMKQYEAGLLRAADLQGQRDSYVAEQTGIGTDARKKVSLIMSLARDSGDADAAYIAGM